MQQLYSLIQYTNIYIYICNLMAFRALDCGTGMSEAYKGAAVERCGKDRTGFPRMAARAGVALRPSGFPVQIVS